MFTVYIRHFSDATLMMGLRVMGIGVGLFVVLFVWTVTLLAYVVLWRSKGLASYARLICFAIATLVTVVLTVIPKTQEVTAKVETQKVYDVYFIGRICLVVAMGVFAVISGILMFLTRWSQPICASTLKPL